MSDTVKLRHVIRRTKTGCLTCRKRRKRCDEAQPICGGCAKLNLKCTYEKTPLRWATTRKPFVEVEKEEGSEGLVVKENNSGYDFAQFDDARYSERSAQLQKVMQDIGATPGLQRIVFLKLSHRDQDVLLKFLTIGHRTLISNLEICSDFLAFFSECETSFASLWSCLTYQVSMDQSSPTLFNEYYHKCLVLFREELSTLRDTDSADTVWFVGSLLCGISANRLLPWTMHVNAMIAFLFSKHDLSSLYVAIPPSPGSKDAETLEILQMLGSFDLPAYILNRQTPYHHLWANHCTGLPGIDEESGLPCSLIDLLATLDMPETSIPKLLDWTTPDEGEEAAQKYSWDATRYAAILRALLDTSPSCLPSPSSFSSPHHQNPSHPDMHTHILTLLSHHHTSIPHILASLLSSVRHCLCSLPPSSTHFKQTLIFPLTMAASQKNFLNGDAKSLIRETMRELAEEGNYCLRLGVLGIIEGFWEGEGGKGGTIEDVARGRGLEVALW